MRAIRRRRLSFVRVRDRCECGVCGCDRCARLGNTARLVHGRAPVASASTSASAGAVWSSAFALPAGAAIYCAVLSLLSYQHKATALFALHPILLIFGVLFFMPLAVVRLGPNQNLSCRV